MYNLFDTGDILLIYFQIVSVNLMAQFANISDKNNSLKCNKEQGEHNES